MRPRLLHRRVSVEAMIEFGLWLAILYVAVGLAWAFFDAQSVQALQAQLETRMPAGSDILAFLTTVALWPWKLLGADVGVC
ncbi:MAG TPA: hypothetical protein VH496_12550 [Mycobacterium sp.]